MVNITMSTLFSISAYNFEHDKVAQKQDWIQATLTTITSAIVTKNSAPVT